MKRYFLFILCILVTASYADLSCAAGKKYTFQGKTSTNLERSISLPFQVQVEEVYVNIGDSVTKDAPLLRYTMEPKEARSWQSKIADYDNTVLNLTQQLASLDVERSKAGNDFKRVRELSKEGFAPSAEIRERGGALNSLKLKKKHLETLLANTKKEQMLFLLELNSYFGSQLKPGDSLPEVFILKAPTEGTIIDIASDTRSSALKKENKTLLTLAQINPIQAEMQVHETEIARFSKGDAVTVVVPSLNNKKFPAKIVSISWIADDMAVAAASFYKIVVDIENNDLSLRAGYKINATIGE